MKFTFVLLALTVLQLKASIFAQKISLSVRDASLTEVISEIRKQTKVNILYNSSLSTKLKPITISVKDEDLKKVLDICLKNQPLSYQILKDNIVITLKNEDVQPGKPETAVRAKDVQVSGKVTDEKGEPIPGATIKVKNAQGTAISDGSGNFKITVPEDAILVFSFVGYKPQEIPVKGRTTISVSLIMQDNSLNDIVVVGYGTQKQKDVTGAVSALTSENFNKGASLSPQALLQGKIAGVNVAQNSGKPGTSNTVRIRGGTSLTGSNDPLYVIDGVPISTSAGLGQASIRGTGTDVFDQEPINPLQTLNPNDIESITVLKDASATAIYGSRGANGVIVITTKNGKAGKPMVSYNGQISVAQVAKKLQVLNADEYRSLVTSLNLPLTDRGANTNWQDEIFRTSFSNDHSVSLSGGSEQTLYRTSFGYGNQQGIVLNSNLQQANVQTNITHTALNNRLKFDLKLNYGQNKSNTAPISNTVGGESGTSMNYEAYVFNPTYPVFDANGNYNHVPPFRINPVSFSTDVQDQKTNQRLLGNLQTSYKIIEPLSVNVSLGYTRQTTDRNSYIDKDNPIGNGFNGYTSVQKFFDYSKLMETVFRFNKTFGKHSIDAIGGYSYQYFYGESDRIIASGFLSDEFKWYSLAGASTINQITSGAESNTLISMYSRVNYNYDSRFLFTGTVRRDGSSRFGALHKWGYFPSGSVAWRISQEEFFKVKAISDLKLRVSYGVTGNQEIGNLNSITTLGPSNNGYIIGGQRVTVVLPQQFANPDLKWETTSQLNVGLNFGFFNNRLHGSFDYYKKKTSDLLLRIAVPQPAVVSTQIANVGSVENKGIELELGGTAITQGKFSWDASLNFSRNINKVLSLSNDLYKGSNIQQAPLQGTVASGAYAQLIMPGYPLGTYFGRKFTGINAAGLETYDPAGNMVLGSAQPKFTYGTSHNLSYGAWTLGLNLRGVYGNLIYNGTANNLGYKNNLPGRNALQSAINDGVSINQPKAFSSRWLESGSFLRLDNATIAYTVPVKSKNIQNLRIFVTGQNLFVITKYTGLDPEVNAEVTASGTPPLGIDYLGYPRSRTYSLGASISFQ
ncbi:MAG: TonB-dependent receptor [Pedobacter sp.]|uniref:TonB-dependent receptor n=1 Tax=Pedobacter sp. TaxID=1411316 RepID=UPI003394BECD